MVRRLSCPEFVAGEVLDPEVAIHLLPGFDPTRQAVGCTFDIESAVRPVEFFHEVLRHPKGRDAGNPFHLQPWQQSLLMNLFGWKRADGSRRFRVVWLYVPKKNGKSAFAGGIALYTLLLDGELGAELYSAASAKDQAALVFSYASGMVALEPAIKRELQVYGGADGGTRKVLVHPSTMSSYKVLASDGDTVDGANVHLAIIDEVHRHKKPDLADILRKSTGARRQPIVIYTTTADYDRPSLCNDMLAYARTVRDNPGDPSRPGYDPSFLPAIYEAPRDCAWDDPETWRAVNPNLGVTVTEDFLRDEARRAKEMPRELNNFLRLHLNIVTETDVTWLDMTRWDEGAGTETFEELAKRMRGQRCYAGLDLSSTTDLTAFVLWFPDHGVVLPHFWVPGDGAKRREDRDHVPYSTWHRQGFIRFTEGDVVDYATVRKDIVELSQHYRIEEVAFDRWGSMQLVTDLQGDGLEVIAFGQGFGSMSAPSKELEALVLKRGVHHAGHPVMRWCAQNAVVETDPAGSIKPSKRKSNERIDGIVALCMAIGRSIVQHDSNVYETRGVRRL